MGIDRIGKGGGGIPEAAPETGAKPSVAGKARAEEASRPFEVRGEKSAATSGASAVEKTSTTPLDRLRAGEIDLERYLDLKGENATAHLRGVPPAELDAIRATLRQRLASDPGLTALVQKATGAVPSPAKDE